MKKILILSLLFLVVGCSSEAKSNELTPSQLKSEINLVDNIVSEFQSDDSKSNAGKTITVTGTKCTYSILSKNNEVLGLVVASTNEAGTIIVEGDSTTDQGITLSEACESDAKKVMKKFFPKEKDAIEKLKQNDSKEFDHLKQRYMFLFEKTYIGFSLSDSITSK